MNMKYDKKVKATYITFKNGNISKTTKVTNNILVDKDIKNNILGIEIVGTSNYK